MPEHSESMETMRAEKSQLEAEVAALRVAKLEAEQQRDQYKEARDAKIAENAALGLETLQAMADAQAAMNCKKEALHALEECKVICANLQFELELLQQQRERTPDRCKSSNERLEAVVEEAKNEAQEHERRAAHFYNILQQEREEKAELCDFIADEGLISSGGNPPFGGYISAENVKEGRCS
ncbi:unnamed protein product [Ostreobium quekettii]|uniref:Uncharacterized protein n=1 Tax=Ostreobium quekettii TaxID=121088 RepID=A0A8S1J1K4_9CHLO|nr:unnamed protein product [Ostreobium quekettii]